MKKLATCTMAIALGLSMQAGIVWAAATQTGQGIMVTFTGANNYALVNNELWSFNTGTAATYFTNAWDGTAPTVTCSGAGCQTGTVPAAPAAPAPNADKVTHPGTGTAETNMCTFLNGGTLVGATYTQTATLSNNLSGNSRATYTYTYTYNITGITPLAPAGIVDPRTAWTLTQVTGGETVPVTISADIAGESVISSTSQARKYSFSIRNSDGTSRVTGLNLAVDNVSYPLTSQVYENCPGCVAGDTGAVDFPYVTNAGSNGVVNLLADGNARDILNTDSFAGNQNGGADGKALAKVVTDSVTVNLAPGSHTVVLTGTVKGNSALANIGFTVSHIIHIITPQCMGNNN